MRTYISWLYPFKYLRQWKLSWRTPLSYVDIQLYLQPPSQNPVSTPKQTLYFPHKRTIHIDSQGHFLGLWVRF